MEAIVKISVLWILYFVMHSVFASHRIKVMFKTHFPGMNAYYRIIYNFFAIIGLLGIVMYQSTLPQHFLYRPHTGLTFLGLSLAAIGLIIIRESFSFYDMKEFLGIRQLKGDFSDQDFLRKGLLRYVRHPLYSGSILLLFGYLIFAPTVINIVTIFFMVLYFITGSYLEEKKLIRAFGHAYLEYKKEVPAFFPKLSTLTRIYRKAKNQ